MNDRQDYIVTTDGWVAGTWRARGSRVSLTVAGARYEHVTPASEAPDDPGVKSSAPTDTAGDDARGEESKRVRAKK